MSAPLLARYPARTMIGILVAPYRTVLAVLASIMTLEEALIASPFSVAAPRADVKSPAVIALGDSYISGEGGRWQGNGETSMPGSRHGTDLAAYLCGPWEKVCAHDPKRVYGSSYKNGCDRSNGAEITYVSHVQIDGRNYNISQGDRINVACSGATTADIDQSPFKGEPRQVDQLLQYAQAKDIKLIAVSIGGNDIQFRDMVGECVKDFITHGSHCNTTLAPELDQRLGMMKDAVARSLHSIRTAMFQAGYRDSDYRLVLQSYPSPVPPAADNRYPESDWARLHLGGCPIYNDDSDWAYGSAVPDIAKALREVAAAVGGVDFLDTSRALAGHEVCAKGIGHSGDRDSLRFPRPKSDSEWVRWIHGFQGKPQESAHPNAFGQQQLGHCLAAAAMSTDHGGSCNNQG
ncbi:GDSL-type esterase/lipase family protein [Mycobacterium haemophilum]|nr:GDSL-type esterase/lipase family protein [Mycobacterium haemophilum]